MKNSSSKTVWKITLSALFVFFTVFLMSCSKEEEGIVEPENPELPNDDSGDESGNVISEKSAIVVIENTGNELWGMDKFKLKVKFLDSKKELANPVSILVSLVDDNNTKLNSSDFFSNFPEKLVFSKKQVESGEIIVKSGSTNNKNITIKFKVEDSDQIELLNPRYRTLLCSNLNTGSPHSGMMDERSVYSRPDREYRSSVYNSHTGLGTYMKQGDPHPNSTLEANGWKFYTAHEFHRYDALPNRIFPQNPQPRGFEKYKNYFMQLHSTFTKESTCRITDSGHLQLWAQRNEKNKIEDRDFNYYPMRQDYLNMYPNPDMYNNWEVGALISDSPNDVTHWADFRPGMRIEIRMRLENQNEAYNPANDIWLMSNRYYTYDKQNGALWPYLNWPNCGEIDLLETRNPKENVICSTIHSIETGNDVHAKTSGFYLSNSVDYAKYNIYWMEWSRNQIKFGINSNCYGVVNGGKDFTVSRGDKKNDDIWAPFTDDEITGTVHDWDKTWFTNPHGFRLIINMEIQKRDVLGNVAWPSGWNTNGPNDIDEWLPSWMNEKNPEKLPKMDIDWIRCYYDEAKGFRGKLLCPGGAYPENNLDINARPQAINY